ncbi:MAG TPA: hypothetical protein VIL07_08625 [Symbiobacteriaceae bacterium]
MGWVREPERQARPQRVRRRLNRKELLAALEEMEAGRSRWRAEHDAAFQELEGLAELLAAVRSQVETAAAEAGAPVPPLERLLAVESRLEDLRHLLESMPPGEAPRQMAALRAEIEQLAAEAERYRTAGTDVIRAEQATCRLHKQAVREGAEEALRIIREAQALLPCLRPDLIAGRMEAFDHELRRICHLLAEARRCVSG